MRITCEPSGLVLNLRGLRPGDIHDVLESLRGGRGGGDTESGGQAAARRIRQRRALRQRRGEEGDEEGAPDVFPTEPQSIFGGGTLVGEILNRLQEAPYVLDVGAYAGTLMAGRPVDFRNVLITDIESAIYHCRETTGIPLSVRPNCGSCGRIAPDPLEIQLESVEHWTCSDAGLRSLGAGGEPVEIAGREWTVSLAPPTLARTIAIDRILSQPLFPASLRIDSTLLSSIGAVMRNAPAPEAAAGGTSTEVDRAVSQVNALTRGEGKSKDVLTLPLDIITWWHKLDDWVLRRDVVEESEDLWGGVDSAYTWTCKADPTICNVEQDGRIPLDLSFFGLEIGAGRRRRNR